MGTLSVLLAVVTAQERLAMANISCAVTTAIRMHKVLTVNSAVATSVMPPATKERRLLGRPNWRGERRMANEAK